VNRRAFLCWLTLGTLCAPIASEAQQTGKMWRIGWLSAGSPTSGEDAGVQRPPSQYRASLRAELRRHGWIERHNVLIEYRFAHGRLERLFDLAAELAGHPVDVIYAETGTAAQAAIRAAGPIPVVFTSGDAVSQGLTSSLSRPDRNATGISIIATDVAGKRLEILKEALPGISSVGVLGCQGGQEAQWRSLEPAARSLNLKLVALDVRSREQLDGAFAAAKRLRVDALFVLDCGLFNALEPELMTRHNLPSMYPFSHFAELGGLLAYGRDPTEAARRTAWYVDRLLRGAKPSELPIEQPMTFRLTINMKTARALGLAIPPSLLLRADQVIE
jgi:putative ABC transport system substrate-binding protein